VPATARSCRWCRGRCRGRAGSRPSRPVAWQRSRVRGWRGREGHRPSPRRHGSDDAVLPRSQRDGCAGRGWRAKGCEGDGGGEGGDVRVACRHSRGGRGSASAFVRGGGSAAALAPTTSCRAARGSVAGQGGAVFMRVVSAALPGFAAMAVQAEGAEDAGGRVAVAPLSPSTRADTMAIGGVRCGGADVGASDRGAAGAAAWLTTPSSTLSVGSEVSAATVCSSSTADGVIAPMDGEARGGAAVNDGGHLRATKGIKSAMLLGDLVSSGNERARAEAAAAAPAEGRGEPPPPASGRLWAGVVGGRSPPTRSTLFPRSFRSLLPWFVGGRPAAETAAAAAADAAISPVTPDQGRVVDDHLVSSPGVIAPVVVAEAAATNGPSVAAPAVTCLADASSDSASGYAGVGAVADAAAAAVVPAVEAASSAPPIPPRRCRRMPRSLSARAPDRRARTTSGGASATWTSGWTAPSTAWHSWRAGSAGSAAVDAEARSEGGATPPAGALPSVGARGSAVGPTQLVGRPLRRGVAHPVLRRSPSSPPLPSSPSAPTLPAADKGDVGGVAADGAPPSGNAAAIASCSTHSSSSSSQDSTNSRQDNSSSSSSYDDRGGAPTHSAGGGSRSWFTAHPSVSAPLSRFPRPGGSRHSGGNRDGTTGTAGDSRSRSWFTAHPSVSAPLARLPRPGSRGAAAGDEPSAIPHSSSGLGLGTRLRRSVSAMPSSQRSTTGGPERRASWLGLTAAVSRRAASDVGGGGGNSWATPWSMAGTTPAVPPPEPFSTITSASELRVLSIGLVDASEVAGGAGGRVGRGAWSGRGRWGRRPPRAFKHILENVRVESGREGAGW